MILIIAEAAYCAGLMDGEGTIALNRKLNRGRENCTYSPRCNIYNTSLELLNWIQDTTNAGSVIPQSKAKAGHKQGYNWSLQTEYMVEFLELILPYLVIKDEHARLLIRYIKDSRNTGPNNSPTIEQMDERDYIFQRLTTLNMRGLK